MSEKNPNSNNPNLITQVPSFDIPQEVEKLPEFVESTDVTASNQVVDPDWNYTIMSKDLHGEKFGGRPQIGRDSQIDGGVYYGTYGGEAIVVDSDKYPKQYDLLFDEVLNKSKSEDGSVDRGKVLQSVFTTVSEKMKYSQEGVDNTLQELAEASGSDKLIDGTKVNLGDFIEDGVGVCRHQALVTGYLLQRMKKEGYIRGDASVERSQRWSPNGEREGHAWVRYTASTGDVMILDIAQRYFGLLEDSEGSKHGWDYLRPEEQLNRVSHNSGKIAVRPEVALA